MLWNIIYLTNLYLYLIDGLKSQYQQLFQPSLFYLLLLRLAFIIWYLYNNCLIAYTPLSTLTTPPGHELEVMVIIFVGSDS